MFAELLIRLFLLMCTCVFLFHAHHELTTYTAPYLQHESDIEALVCSFAGVMGLIMVFYNKMYTDPFNK